MAAWRRILDDLHWWLVARLTPGLRNAQHSYVELLEQAVTPATRWLDLGCGHRLLPAWMKQADLRQRSLVSRARLVVGVDLDMPSLHRNDLLRGRVLAGNLESLPFDDGAFDLVTANMVVEHLSNPAAALGEINRVLRPGGRLIFHTPNRLAPFTRLTERSPQWLKHLMIRLLENRDESDVFPTHYRLNREEQIHAAASAAGLRVEAIDLVESSPELVMLGPAVIPELLMIRVLRHPALRAYRSNLIVTLSRPAMSVKMAA
jgi:SAM-dependent methyltransferase